MMRGQRTAIVFATDSRLLPVAAFQLARLHALGVPADVDIVIATDASEQLRLVFESGLRFRPLPLDTRLVSEIRMVGVPSSPATYYRVFLPRLLPDYARLLYLDTDVYIHTSTIFRLLELPMAGRAVGAVRDLMMYRGRENEIAEVRRTTRNIDGRYFNSGVLLVEPVKFIEDQIERRVMQVVASRAPLWLHDQSALNIVLEGNWLELSPACNMFPALWESFVSSVYEPIVVHFAGPSKPWHGPRFSLAHPVKAEMEAFFAKSPWRSFLSSFYGVREALADIQHADLPRQRKFRPNESVPFMKHLFNTRFADVDAGVTVLQSP